MSTLHVLTLLLAVLFVAAPGAGLTLALFPPGRISLAARAGLVVPLGFAAVGLLGLVLALLHLLTLPVLLTLYLAGTAAAWWIGLRRGGLRPHLAAWREEVRDDRWLFAAFGLLLLVVIGIRLAFPPLLNMDGLTPLRYWADAVEIADAGRIPEATLQWGHLIDPTISKVVLNTFGGASALVLGSGPLQPMGALLFVSFLGLFLGAFALGRELGLRLTAPLLPVILFVNRLLWNHEFTRELDRYRAENWGRLLVLGGLILGVRALRAERFLERRREALAAGVLFGAAAGTHLVAFSVGVALLASYGLVRAVADRRLTPLVPTGTAMAAVALILGAFVLLAPRGDIGFQGASGPDTYEEIRERLDLDPDFDPTVFIARGAGARSTPDDPLIFSPGRMVSFFTSHMIGIPRLPGARLILPVVALAMLTIIFRWGWRELQIAVVTAVVFAAALLAVALFFLYRFDVFVLAQFGARRLFDYALIPSALLGLGVLDVGLRSLRDRRARLGRWRPPARLALATAVLVLGAGAALPSAAAPRDRIPVLESGLEAFGWIRDNVPCEGRVLADRRTLATFQTMTDRAGVLEGMGPHLRPHVLALAIEEMLGAQEFFRDPGSHEAYLRENGVAAVVVTGLQYGIGGHVKLGGFDLTGLTEAPFLRHAAEFPESGIQTFEVVTYREEWTAGLPRVEGQPGYACGETSG